MAKLLTGTRIYGTGTVDTQLFVSGTNSATSTTTGALQVVGGVGIGGNLYVGGTIFGGTLSGTASTATNADNIKTVLQTSSASHYLAFVDANNSTAAYEALYTTSSFIINPQSGTVGIGTATITSTLEVFSSSPGVKINDGISNVHVQVNGSNPRVVFIDGRSGGRRFDIGSSFSTATFSIIDRTAGIERLLIDANGNIGIGTTTPASKFVVYGGTVNSTTYTSSEARIADGTLHLMKTSAGGVFEALRAINNDTTVGTTVRLLAAATSDPFNNANGGKVFIDAVRTASNMDLIFSLNDASGAAAVERLRILGSGAIAFNGSTSYGVSGQILQSNGNAAPTWISTGSLAAANATTATHLAGGVAGQIPYQTAPGVTAFLNTGTAGNVLVSNGSSAPTYNNTLTLTGTTAATSTTTGALQVVGGFGLGGDLFIRGDIATNDTTFNLINSTATTVNFAGAATTLTMGASGSGTTNVRNNLTVSGNLTVQGTTTIVDSTVTNIADPILTLGGGTGNTAPTADDNKDRGVAFKWVNDSGTTSTGFFGYDDSTGYFTYVQTATITNEVVSGTKGAMDVNLAGGTAMSIVYQSSPNATGFLAASTSGYILQTNGTGSPPTWVSAGGVSAGSATYADNIRTIAQTASASYYPTFVDSNNASNAYELVYTTSSFSINPATGSIGIGGGVFVSGTTSTFVNTVIIGTSTVVATVGSGFNTGTIGSHFIMGAATGYGTPAITLQRNESGTQTSITSLLGPKFPGVQIIGDSSAAENYPGSLMILTPGAGVVTSRGPEIYLISSRASTAQISAGTFSATQINDQLGRIFFGGDQGTVATSSLRATGAFIASNAVSTWSSTSTEGALSFGTTPFGSTGATERLRITSAGGISFGASGTAYGSSGFVLKSNGNAAPTWVDPSTLASSSATNADNIRTLAQTANASYYPTFVDSNNASNAYELVYTTSSFSINPATGFVGIGSQDGASPLNVKALSTLSGTINSFQKVLTTQAAGGLGNNVYRSEWRRRRAAGTDWTTQNVHDGIWVDSSFTTPGTDTKAWWERDPNTPSQSWGDSNVTWMFHNSSALFLTGGSSQLNTGFTNRLNVTGSIVAGTASSTNGSIILQGQYGTGSITNLGTEYSSGGPVLSYGVYPSNAGTGAFFSSSGLALTRAAYTQAGNVHNWYVGASQTVAIGSAATLSLAMSVSSSGINLPTAASGNANISFDGTTFTLVSNSSSAGLVLSTNSTERLRITPSGGISFGASGTAYGSSGQILQSNGNAAPTWINQSSIASGQVSTVLQTASATYYPTFVDANNATATAESLYTTSSFTINAMTGNVGIAAAPSSTATYRLNVSNIIQVGAQGGSDVTLIGGGAGTGSFLKGYYGTDGTQAFNILGNGASYVNASSAGGTFSVGTSTVGTNGLLQVNGGIGLAANSTVRQVTNGDGGTLKFYGTQFVAGSQNSGSYGYTGAGLLASVSPSASAIMLDAGGQALGTSHRLKVVNDGTGITGYLYYGQEGGSTATLYANVATGNVGVGTTSPTAKLHVVGNTIISGNAVIGATTTTNKFEVAGTAGQLFSVSDSFTGTIFSVNDVSGIPSIEVLDTGLIKMSQYNGAVAIGTGTVSSSTAELSVYGMLYTSGAQGEIRASSEITAYFSSDRRLKENIKLIENPITIIDQIRGVTFDWTDEHMARRGGEDGYFVRKHDIGVIAQEVQAVLPELVGTREDGYLAVKYEKMVPLLIEAIKAQQKTIDSLVKDLDNIKEFINDLKNKNGI
jgi:hypothetical protein